MTISPVRMIPAANVDHLDVLLLDDRGRLKPVRAAVYAALPVDHIRMWCFLHGVYGLPTLELVEHIKGLIGGRRAIEIGSGNGCLGRALGIPMTDSYAQTKPEVLERFAAMGQPPVQYGEDVEEADALEAVRRHKPEVVVGSWITEVYSDLTGAGSPFGVDEIELLSQVDSYIMFGSVRNHGTKVLCIRVHKMIREPYMYSRAQDPALFVWENRGDRV